MRSSYRFLLSVVALACAGALNVFAGNWIVLDQFPTPRSGGSGLAWDGEYLWMTTKSHIDEFYRIDPTNGQVVESFRVTSPGAGFFEGLTYADGYLYVHCISLSEFNKIFKIDPQNGSVVDVLSYNIGKGGQGLAYDHETQAIWAVQARESDETVVSSINLIKDGVALQTITLDELMAEGDPADGLAYGDGILFAVNNAAEISLVDVQTEQVYDRFQAPGGIGIGPEGLAWDGQYLWYVDNEDNMIYKLGLVNDEDVLVTVDGRANSITDPDAPVDPQAGVKQALTLTMGVEYRVTVARQAFDDNGNTAIEGVYIEYTDEVGFQRVMLQKQGNFIFTCGSAEADNFRAYIVDDDPADNTGEYLIFVEREFHTATGVEEHPDVAPIEASRIRATPNPMSNGVEISYILGAPAQATIDIYDAAGIAIRRLANTYMSQGAHRAYWDATDGHNRSVAAGTYYCRISVNGNILATRTIVVVR